MQKGYLLQQIRTPVRIEKDYVWKVNATGVVAKGQSQYKSEEKAGRSKKQSVTLVHLEDDPKKNFTPPIFGWNKDRAKEGLTGVMFFSNNINNDPNLLLSITMEYDGGTYLKPGHFNNHEAAQQYAAEKIFDLNTNPYGVIFSGPKELF